MPRNIQYGKHLNNKVVKINIKAFDEKRVRYLIGLFSAVLAFLLGTKMQVIIKAKNPTEIYMKWHKDKKVSQE